MKKVFPFSLILLFCIVIGVMGCGMAGTERNRHRGMTEEIDPFAYGDEFEFGGSWARQELKRAESAGEKPAKAGVAEPLPKPPEVEVKKPVETRESGEPSDAEKQAEGVIYRVQIGVFEEQKSAEARAGEARAKVNMNVYVDFEPPFYRVRVGDFTTRKEAEQQAKIMQNYGFRGAFWVMKKVNVP